MGMGNRLLGFEDEYFANARRVAKLGQYSNFKQFMEAMNDSSYLIEHWRTRAEKLAVEDELYSLYMKYGKEK
jgi:hypothetical protein